MTTAPSLLNIHTPASSFSIIHSLTQDTLQSLYDKLTRKCQNEYNGARVGPGWLKYEHNDAIWNLDDDSDYTIFTWRLQSLDASAASSSSFLSPHEAQQPRDTTPMLHLHNPTSPLPSAPAYTNASYYAFRPPPSHRHGNRSNTSSPKPRSMAKSKASKKTTKSKGKTIDESQDASIPVHKSAFDKFHSENGVRTVIGNIGPVQNVRMLLKSGYRHVYISRKFAMKHGFIPADAAPGYYGYGGLVNIGIWPISLAVSPKDNSVGAPESGHDPANQAAPQTIANESSATTVGTKRSRKKPATNGHIANSSQKTISVPVYLSEEPHFDVVLGRSFFEKRQIKIDPTDMTDVVCMDTGEKVHCELVILKDGRGEIVTVT